MYIKVHMEKNGTKLAITMFTSPKLYQRKVENYCFEVHSDALKIQKHIHLHNREREREAMFSNGSLEGNTMVSGTQTRPAGMLWL